MKSSGLNGRLAILVQNHDPQPNLVRSPNHSDMLSHSCFSASHTRASPARATQEKGGGAIIVMTETATEESTQETSQETIESSELSESSEAFTVPGFLPVLPCANCGLMGWIRKAGKSPKRYSGKRFGVDGLICAGCYDKLKRLKDKSSSLSSSSQGKQQSERYQEKIERAVERYNTPPEELMRKFEEMERRSSTQGLHPRKSSIGDLEPDEACRVILDMWQAGVAWRLTTDVDIEDSES
jgi:hypothetical protein